jgi:hypothetical protein
MDFLIITLANLIWIIYSMSEGIREGFFNYFQFLSRKRESGINKIFNLQRFLVLLTTGGIMFWHIGLYFIPLMICQLFMFKFFYNKTYNITIKHLKVKEVLNKDRKKRMINVEHDNLVLFGVTLQIFIYIFYIA